MTIQGQTAYSYFGLATFANLTAVVETVLDNGAMPVTLGGDHSITGPIVKAIAGAGARRQTDHRDGQGHRHHKSSTAHLTPPRVLGQDTSTTEVIRAPPLMGPWSYGQPPPQPVWSLRPGPSP